MTRSRYLWIFACVGAMVLPFVLPGCNNANRGAAGNRPLTIGVAFETLQTEYWVASFAAIKDELKKRDITMLEAIADGDPNRQLQQINSFIARGVDGLIVVPKDSKSVAPVIEAANKAKVPIVLYNRPPAEGAGEAPAVVADNRKISLGTVRYLCEQAKKAGGKHQAMIVLGNLADINAVGRKEGFEDAVKEFPEVVEVVAQVPTDWNQDKALSGTTNALQAHPEVNLIFVSSDFLLPSVVSALKAAGKYHPIGQPGHVLLAGFDGDAYAYQMLKDGYLDADGVQDVAFECKTAIDAVLDMRAGKKVPATLPDPGFVIHRGNLEQDKDRMWGANIKR